MMRNRYRILVGGNAVVDIGENVAFTWAGLKYPRDWTRKAKPADLAAIGMELYQAAPPADDPEPAPASNVEFALQIDDLRGGLSPTQFDAFLDDVLQLGPTDPDPRDYVVQTIQGAETSGAVPVGTTRTVRITMRGASFLWADPDTPDLLQSMVVGVFGRTMDEAAEAWVRAAGETPV